MSNRRRLDRAEADRVAADLAHYAAAEITVARDPDDPARMTAHLTHAAEGCHLDG